MFLAWYIIALLLPVPVPLWFFITVPFLNFFMMVFYKDFGSKGALKEFNFYRLSMVVFSLTVVGYLRKWINYTYSLNIPIVIALIFSVIVFIVAIYILFGDNEKMRNFGSTTYILNKTGNGEDGSKNLDLDVVLCKTPNGEDVVWGGLDRFLHLLILGPTGCGKTSLILIPMIMQDIMKGRAVTVIEPKGDLAEMVYAMGVEYGNPVMYLNPTFPDCPYFNPLDGSEDRIIETITTIFRMLTPDSRTYFLDMNDNLLRKGLMVVKRIEMAYTDPNTGISSRPATLITLSDLINNTEGRGRQMVQELGALPAINSDEKKQNADTRDWFLNTYYSERSKDYENTSGVRMQVANLIQNPYLRRIFNPPDGKSQINFDECLEKGKSIAISTAQGELRELGSYLGYFIIYSLQASIFRRKGTEDNRLPNFLYIDEFQKYANKGFEDILTEGRSFRVSATLATQARGLIANGMNADGKKFLDTVDANCRNVVVFSGISSTDSKYFSELFGNKTEMIEQVSYSEDEVSLFSTARQGNKRKTVAQKEEEKPIFTSSSLIYSGVKDITYRIIKNMRTCEPERGEVSWINADLNRKLKKIASVYREEQLDILAKRNEDELNQKRELYANYLANKGIIKPVISSKSENKVVGAKIQKETLGDSVASFGSVVPEPTLESNEAEWSEDDEYAEEEEMLYRDEDVNKDDSVFIFD